MRKCFTWFTRKRRRRVVEKVYLNLKFTQKM